ncbi:aldose 1-epimerase [Alicyclobacillus ferrooxydans]|uniref:Aldose epimerase n=1 Tax=Alicyclobacillus ferrooxydans TaxID=471514 RepID=A0A0P9D4D2_9BACL|nr:aldose 1-epimerase [Alicyclobacillus ferrooxydans]KPV44336.1 aldose epimerase [Alicyclobacillus ferrooxydans]
MQTSVKEHNYNGTQAVSLYAGAYHAMVLPELGGNLVAFEDSERGLQFLRTPSDLESFRKHPVLYGIPVLFPPNRYEDGTFTVNGKTYHLPINETDKHNHLHGFLKDVPWDVSAIGTTDRTAFIELKSGISKARESYRYFPHEFTITIRYTLSTYGLQQEVAVKNVGPDAMPFMLGFHTTLAVPFAKESNQADYSLKVTLGDRWEMSDRMLPTGRIQPLSVEEKQMQGDGINPFYTQLDNHYSAEPQDGVNYMTLTDNRLGIRLVYDVGPQYKQWMVFNRYATGEMVCPEPQTSMVNAPNVGLSPDESGLLMLAPGESWSATSRLYAEEV